MFINNSYALLRGAFLRIDFARMGASFLFGSLGIQALQVSQEA